MNQALLTALADAIDKLRALSQGPKFEVKAFKDQLKVVETLADGLATAIQPAPVTTSAPGAGGTIGDKAKSAPDWVAERPLNLGDPAMNAPGGSGRGPTGGSGPLSF